MRNVYKLLYVNMHKTAWYLIGGFFGWFFSVGFFRVFLGFGVCVCVCLGFGVCFFFKCSKLTRYEAVSR